MTNDSQASVQPPATSSIISIVCRICYDTDKDEVLITPCDCKGTIGFVHQTCLENWLASSNSATCELCHYSFDVERCLKYNSTESLWYWCRNSGGTMMPVRNDILACTLITPLTIIITYVCLLSSQYYSQIKFNNEPSARWTSFSLLCMVGIMFIGYYTWVYAVIRMHGRRWYYWWQRNCTVRLRVPPERSNRITGVTVTIVNERAPQNRPRNVQDSVPQSTLERAPQSDNLQDIVPQRTPERTPQNGPDNLQDSVPQRTLERPPQSGPDNLLGSVPQRTPERAPPTLPQRLELYETSSSIDQLLDDILATQNTEEETTV